MAISITVDNNRTTIPPNPPFDPLLLDETAGVQTPVTTDDGNEIDVTLTAGALGGFATAFNTFLNGLGLTTAQKEYARDHDGASSTSTFVLVTTSAGETIDDLFFANSTGGALVGVQVVGMTTLDGQNVYLWSNGNFGSSGDFCVATTSNVAGAGEVVAAFYLNENTTDHKSAQVQMVVFEPLEHNNDGVDPDDALNFTDALRVGAAGSLSFDFDELASQSSLWVAVGNASEAVLISGGHPVVNNTTGKKTNASDVIHTSQGGAGATIGVNNQLFDNVGETAVFTLVTGLQGLVGQDDGVLSDYVVDDPTSGATEQGIAYNGYLQNVLGAGIFISQDQGNPNATKSLDINVFATNVATEEEGFGYVYADGGTKSGDALTNDNGVNVTSVTIRDASNALVGTWVAGADPDGAGPLHGSGDTVAGVQVTITGNNIDVNNFGVQYTISWTTASAFNRFNVVNEAGAWDIGRVDIARTIPQNTPIGDKLLVEDDGPTPGTTVLKHVDEDAMAGAGAGDLSTGHIEAPADADGIAGEQDEVTFTQADLAAAIVAGTDAPAYFSLNASLANGTAVKTTAGANVFSQGDQVFYRTVGGVIQGVTDAGTVDERIIFTITRNDNALIGDPSDDTFTFDLKDQLDHANGSGELSLVTLNVTPAFSAKDQDNDPVNFGTSALIRVEVENDTARPDGDFVRKHVDEDAMTGAAGSDLSTGHIEAPADADGIAGEQDEVSFSQADLQGVVTNGADEPVLFGLSASLANGTAVTTTGGANVFSKGDQVFYRTVGGVIQGVTDAGTVDERIIFTITRNDNALIGDKSDDTFTFDLKDQLDHANGSGELSLVDLNVTPAFSASDFDGDAVDFTGSNAIRVEVENDTPRPDGDFVRKHVDEDAMTGAAGSDLSTGHIEAPADADGIAGEQDEISFNQADLQGVVTNGADEPVLFGLNASLADGTAVKTTGGANVFSKGDQVFYRTVGGVIQGVTDAGTVDERIIFTITRNDNALIGDKSDDTFTFDLKDQLDHANGSGELSLVDLNVTPAFSASDFDGDAVDFTGSNAIRVEVENDTPRPDGDTLSKEVHEDALTGGNLDAGDPETKVVTVTYTKAQLIGLATTGADEDLTFSLNTAAGGQPGAIIGTNVVTTGGAAVLSKGLNVVWAAGDTPGSLKGVVGGTTIFTLTPSGDDYVFTLVDQVDHSGAEDDLELLPIDLTSAFKAVDFDLDPLTLNPDSVVLNVENDLPIFDAQIVSQTLDWVDNAFVTGSLHGKIGGDEQASYIIDKYTDLAGYTETLSLDGKTLTYSIGGTTYFTLALSDAANSGAGGYIFTVNEPPVNQVLELDFADLDSGQNLFGTVAFDKANVNNNGTPGDTSDDFLPDGGLMTFPTNIDINDGEAGEDNDGDMTNTSGTTNTSKGGGPVTIGNSNQAFDNAGEGAWFVYVDNPVTTAVSGVGLNANLADDADNMQFDGAVEVTKASVEIVQASGAGTAKRPGPAMNITAYDIDPGKVDNSAESRAFALDPTTTGDQANIIGVKIYNANGELIEYRTNEDNGATNDGDLQDIPGITDDSAVVIQFNLDDNGGTPLDPTDDIYSALVSNLRANFTIEWETEEGHDAAKVERVSGSYDIGGFNLLQGQDAADVDFEFSVGIVDQDGDITHFNAPDQVFDDFKIKVDGTGSFNDPLNVAPSPFLTSYDLV